jgi:predicted protein tyrosine phosphatase
MYYIENVAAIDVQNGNHFDCGENSMLIQIADPAGWFPTPKHKFKEDYQFEFLDVDAKDDLVEYGCSQEQAKELVILLQRALENRMNVVVHCTAGICRSGGVVEVAVIMGFNDPGKFRLPNYFVKRRMLEELNFYYGE